VALQRFVLDSTLFSDDGFLLITDLELFRPLAAKYQAAVAGIGKRAGKSPYQVVCPQEIQLHEYQRLLVKECNSSLISETADMTVVNS
jgi:hypothetical protein